jgi:hypothetical protein
MRPHRMNPANIWVKKLCHKRRMHNVGFNSKGQLCCPNHSRAMHVYDLALLDLGGKLFGCGSALRTFRNCLKTKTGFSKLPRVMVPYCKDCIAEHDRREQLRARL